MYQRSRPKPDQVAQNFEHLERSADQRCLISLVKAIRVRVQKSRQLLGCTEPGSLFQALDNASLHKESLSLKPLEARGLQASRTSSFLQERLFQSRPLIRFPMRLVPTDTAEVYRALLRQTQATGKGAQAVTRTH
jgi:hypothetical protein